MDATTRRQQLLPLAFLLALYMLSAAVYVFLPGGMPEMASRPPAMQVPALPRWQMALGNAALILAFYGLAGYAGLWLARRAGLPGIYREAATARDWLLRPIGVGAVAGIVLVGIDVAVRLVAGSSPFEHPPFPASIVASVAAGVGEEILFRLLVMSLWVLLLDALLRRLFPRRHLRPVALGISNAIAALAFAAGHLGTATYLAGATSPAELPALTIAALIALNGVLGLAAGAAFARDGLVAAAGVHFWADVVWHVLYGVAA